MISEGLDRDLPWSKRLAVRMHVLMCKSCNAYRRQVKAIDKLVRGASERGQALGGDPSASLDDQQKARLKASLREHPRA